MIMMDTSSSLHVVDLDFFICLRCVGVVDIKDVVLALTPPRTFLTA